MPLPRWALVLADNNGRTGSTDATLASVISLSHLDERALVAEAQAGSRVAFEELVRRFDRDVLRLALNLMKRPEDARSEEHTSELQSQFHLVCRLLLEKKKTNRRRISHKP